MRAWFRRARSRHAWFATALALLVAAAGTVWSTRVAAGADAYGYVSQADLYLRGSLFLDQEFAAAVPWPLGRWTFAPLGYRPEPAGYRIVPAYSAGLPILMAAGKALAGQCAVFMIVPLAGGVLTFATYWIGRRIGRPLVGLAAAWMVATSPAMLFMLMAPMSDVPAAAAWTVAVALALGARRRNAERAPSGRATRASVPRLARAFAGEAGLLGACSRFSNTLLGETPLAALGAGFAAAIAILIRPNLAPLAGVLGLWLVLERKGREDRKAWFSLRALRSLRSLFFVGAASTGAVAVALINARLYGSPLASGYGDLSEAYSWSYILPNARRYLGWLVSTQTPLAAAGLACLFVRSRALWPTGDARRALWLLAGFAAAVWASYLVYLPWDAWWYLRFLLPAWPMMAIGTASLLAAVYRTGSVTLRGAALSAAFGLGVIGVYQAAARDTFQQAEGEAKYVEVSNVVDAIAPPDAVIISGQFSGSLRYYTGRLTLRWEYLDPRWLDRAVEWLAARGYRVYVVLEEPEVEPFRSRFSASNAAGTVDWPPLVSFRGGAIKLYDAVDRARFERPVEQPVLRAVRECLPQRPPPRLKPSP